MVLRSRKPEARKFAKWVTGEVLPAIRKTGVYVGKPFAVNPGDVLTQEEQNTLRLMLKSAVEKLPKEQQGAAMMRGWSKLKAHFGVPYREIPRREFTEAVSIIARHTAEWELVDDTPKLAQQPTVNEVVDGWVKRIEEPNGYPATVFIPLVDAVQRKLGRRLPPGKMLVDRQKLLDLRQDLGKLRARIDGMGVLESDLPPTWWAQHRISNG